MGNRRHFSDTHAKQMEACYRKEEEAYEYLKHTSDGTASESSDHDFDIDILQIHNIQNI